jgi:hypothetical protein
MLLQGARPFWGAGTCLGLAPQCVCVARFWGRTPLPLPHREIRLGLLSRYSVPEGNDGIFVPLGQAGDKIRKLFTRNRSNFGGFAIFSD